MSAKHLTVQTRGLISCAFGGGEGGRGGGGYSLWSALYGCAFFWGSAVLGCLANSFWRAIVALKLLPLPTLTPRSHAWHGPHLCMQKLGGIQEAWGATSQPW